MSLNLFLISLETVEDKQKCSLKEIFVFLLINMKRSYGKYMKRISSGEAFRALCISFRKDIALPSKACFFSSEDEGATFPTTSKLNPKST